MAVAGGPGCRAGHGEKPQSAVRGTCCALHAVRCRRGERGRAGLAASSTDSWRCGHGPGLSLDPGLPSPL